MRRATIPLLLTASLLFAFVSLPIGTGLLAWTGPIALSSNPRIAPPQSRKIPLHRSRKLRRRSRQDQGKITQGRKPGGRPLHRPQSSATSSCLTWPKTTSRLGRQEPPSDPLFQPPKRSPPTHRPAHGHFQRIRDRLKFEQDALVSFLFSVLRHNKDTSVCNDLR